MLCLFYTVDVRFNRDEQSTSKTHLETFHKLHWKYWPWIKLYRNILCYLYFFVCNHLLYIIVCPLGQFIHGQLKGLLHQHLYISIIHHQKCLLLQNITQIRNQKIIGNSQSIYNIGFNWRTDMTVVDKVENFVNTLKQIVNTIFFLTLYGNGWMT